MREAWTAAGRVLAGLLFAAALVFVALVAAGAILTGSPAVAQTQSDIRGTVTDSSTGAGIGGINVVLEAQTLPFATQTAVTDEQGEYVFEDVVPADYRLAFEDPAFAPRECDEDPYLPAEEFVETGDFPDDDSDLVVDAELDPGAHIFGVVRAAATGDPAADVLVAALPVFPFVATPGFAFTDESGEYEMCGFSAAFYDVFFLPDVDAGLNAEIVRDLRLQLGEKRELNMRLLGVGDAPPKLIAIQLSRSVVAIGDDITATTEGEFKASSQTFAFVFSEPVPVAAPLADTAGAVQFTFTVTEAIGEGDHQLRIFGVDDADNAVVGIADFTVQQVTPTPTPTPTPAPPTPTPTPTPAPTATPTATQTPTPGPGLPKTGSDTFPMIVIATWSIFVGMLMREHARRRGRARPRGDWPPGGGWHLE